MHYLYILYSKHTDRYYIGETSDVDYRINLHNEHYYKNAYTKISNDWELVLNFECCNRSDALYLERFIKKMKSKVFIKKIVLNPSILKDILKNRADAS